MPLAFMSPQVRHPLTITTASLVPNFGILVNLHLSSIYAIREEEIY